MSDLNEALKGRKPRKSRAKFREGQSVKIINPEFFVRCGYPLDLPMAETYVQENFGKDIDELLSKVTAHETENYSQEKIHNYTVSLSSARAHHYDKAHREIVRGLAYAYVQHKRFGGPERSIYTKRIDELAGRFYTISSVKYVMTGKYYCPSGGFNSWTGEYDCEPGGLENQKSHRILILCGYYHSSDLSVLPEQLMIEDIHVEKQEAII